MSTKLSPLQSILAEYFTWKGEAITEINQTANYKRMEQAILKLIKDSEEEAYKKGFIDGGLDMIPEEE